MLDVGGRPLLETIIRNVVQQGFRNIFISVNYRAEMIVDHFGDGAALGAAIQYLHEAERLGTAGALGLLPPASELPVVVMNGDILTTINYGALLDFHNGTPAQATMAVREHKVHVPYGVVSASEGYLEAIREKPTETWFVSAGIYVIGHAALDHVERGIAIDMPTVLERIVANKGRVAIYPIREYWLDIGRMEDFERAHAEFQRGLPVTLPKAVVVGLGSIGQRHARRAAGTRIQRRDGQPSQRRQTTPRSPAPSLRPVRNMPSSQPRRHVMPNRFVNLPMPVFAERSWWKSRFSAHRGSVADYPFARVVVGYNLRFHPVMTALAEKLARAEGDNRLGLCRPGYPGLAAGT